MKVQSSKFRVQSCGTYILAILFLVAAYGILCDRALAADKWQGVDESVVQKIAKEHGREAHEPIINTDQGDLLLFVFLLAGTIGGFAAGYYWRILMVEKTEKTKKEKCQDEA
jgi:ABC-type cobalt transport system substrate-binding protein